MLKAGETCPAQFVGEFTSLRDERHHRPVRNPGDVALVRLAKAENHIYTLGEIPAGSSLLLVMCAVCGAIDELPLDFDWSVTGNARWQLTSRDPVNIEPSIVLQIGEPGNIKRRCHYFVHNGRFEALGDCLPWQP